MTIPKLLTIGAIAGISSFLTCAYDQPRELRSDRELLDNFKEREDWFALFVNSRWAHAEPSSPEDSEVFRELLGRMSVQGIERKDYGGREVAFFRTSTWEDEHGSCEKGYAWNGDTDAHNLRKLQPRQESLDDVTNGVAFRWVAGGYHLYIDCRESA